MSLDFGAFLITCIGLWRLRVKDKGAFLVFSVSSAMWMWHGVTINSFPLTAMNTVFFAFNGAAWWQWRRDEQKDKPVRTVSVRALPQFMKRFKTLIIHHSKFPHFKNPWAAMREFHGKRKGICDMNRITVDCRACGLTYVMSVESFNMSKKMLQLKPFA